MYPSEDEDVMLCGEGPNRKAGIAKQRQVGLWRLGGPRLNVRMSVLAFPYHRR